MCELHRSLAWPPCVTKLLSSPVTSTAGLSPYTSTATVPLGAHAVHFLTILGKHIFKTNIQIYIFNEPLVR